jgi:hypothetical protein
MMGARTSIAPSFFRKICAAHGLTRLGREHERRDHDTSECRHPYRARPAGSTVPHHDGPVGAALAQPTAKAPAIIISRLLTRLEHLLSTIQEAAYRTVQVGTIAGPDQGQESGQPSDGAGARGAVARNQNLNQIVGKLWKRVAIISSKPRTASNWHGS